MSRCLFHWGAMARAFAVDFYNSQDWKSTRADAMERDEGLCQECLKRGLIEPARIVHHIVHLTPANIANPDVSLSLSNLVSLCYPCHARVHGYTRSATREGFYFDEQGNLKPETELGYGL